MKNDLEPAKKVLRDFIDETEKVKALRNNISAPQPALAFTVKDKEPVFDQSKFIPAPDSYWEKDDAYIWLHADVRNYHSFMNRPKPAVIPEYYHQLAWPIYQQWRQEEKEVFYRKCAQIPPPDETISLLAYLQKLEMIVSEENEHRDVWIESLLCFLQFLREDTELDQKGPLEILFPSHEGCKGMEFRKDYSFEREEGNIVQVECRRILRRVEKTVISIDILVASEIIKNLAKVVLHGRPNSKRSAAEALGFAWLCLAVGSYRLVTREGLVFATEIDKLRLYDENNSQEPFTPTRFIGISSLFGIIDVPVSKTLYEFLLALPRQEDSNRIFNMPWQTLCRTFQNKGVKPSKRAQDLGKISFLTFMSNPHEVIGHRSSHAKPDSSHL